MALSFLFLVVAFVSASTKDLNWHLTLPTAPASLKALPFNLQQVRLTNGSFWYRNQDLNRQYLLNLNSDSMLWNFRTTAGLPAPGTPYPGWEDPTCELRGHFVGHWLSASALMWASTGDASLKTKMTDIVTELGKCQTAMGTGYLSAFPTEEFDRLEAHQSVWAPYYTIHKIMAGLLDQYQVANNSQAFTMVTAMADYFYGRIQKVLSSQGMNGWQQILGVEWGGMNDVMYSIYALTNKASHLDMANLFDHYSWTRPLAAGQDDLSGNHANTHIPEIIGNTRAWEVVSNSTQQTIATNFYSALVNHHSWVTGGSNDNEYWGPADRLGDALNIDTEESCTQYNVQKVARHMFGWGGEARFFDFYERAMLNGLVGNQKDVGTFLYMMPIGQPGQTKGDNNGASGNVHWGHPYTDFWCCYGTMIESFSKLGDSVYFYSPDNSAVYVNQYIPSTLTWSAKGVTLVQKTDFPVTSATTISVSAAPGTSFTINLRIPIWAQKPTVSVNGQPYTGAVTPGTYVSLTQAWAAGNTIDATFPMAFSAEHIQDTRSQYASVYGFMYGPLLLGGETSSFFLPVSTTDFSWITRTSTTALTFVAHPETGSNVTFLPLLNIISEKYTIYFNTSGVPEVHYNASGSVVPTSTNGDFQCSGGASVISNPTLSLRSGNPNEVNTVYLTTGIQDDTHAIDGLSLDYSYVTGYGSGTGTNFTVSLESASGANTVIYTSPQLTDYSYDSCNTCYSPPVPVSKTGLALSATSMVRVKFVFQDNSKNVQLKLPINVTVHWK